MKTINWNYEYMEKYKICTICFKRYTGFGNNAEPINRGRCCDICNSKVILARIELIKRRTDEEK